MKTTQVIVVVFMFLFCGINLHAQENYYKTYSVNDGLLSSDNYMTLQDSKGYMWICSSKGITKFDGKNFTYFTVKDGLPTNDIWYIKEDSKQRIWIGGFFKGLYYILNDSVVKLKSEIDANRILLNVEFNDTLIFCSDLNNYYLENNKLEKYNVKKVDYRKIRSSDNSIEFNHHLNQEFNEVRLLKYNKDLRLNMQHIDYKSFLLNNDKQFVLSNDKRKMTIYFDSVIKIIDVENYFGGVISEIKTITPTKEVMIKINDSIRVYKNLLTLERNKNMEEKLLPFLSTRIGWITIDNEKNLWITEYRGVIIFIPFNNQNIIRSNIKVKKDGNNIFNLTYFNHKVYFNSLTGNLYSYKTNNKQINKIQNRDFQMYSLKSNLFHSPDLSPLEHTYHFHTKSKSNHKI